MCHGVSLAERCEINVKNNEEYEMLNVFGIRVPTNFPAAAAPTPDIDL